MRHCTKPGCTRPHYAHGLCNKHYNRQRNGYHHGNTKGDHWYQARLDKGHEFTLAPGTHKPLPTPKDQPEHLPLEAIHELPYEPDFDHIAEAALARKSVSRALEHLPSREREIIERHWLQPEPETLTAIAQSLHVTRGRASQLEHAALKRLKELLKAGHITTTKTPIHIDNRPKLFIDLGQRRPFKIHCPYCNTDIDYPHEHHCLLEFFRERT